MKRVISRFVFAGGAVALGACSSADNAPAKTDAQYKDAIIAEMHDSLLKDIDALLQAAKDMQTAAPTTQGRGWDKAQDAAAIQATKDAWIRARVAYEHVEGALAPLFPDVDASIDFRYDDFLSTA